METKLFDAIKNNNFTEVKTLIEEGADVNVKTKDDYGLTPLHYASSYGNAKIVKLLIEHGADVNARGEYGCTPLHDASNRGYTEIVNLLIKNGADVNHKSIDGRDTALKVAYCEENDDILNLLRENGAEQLDDDDDCYCGKQASAGRKMCKDCYHQEYGY